MKPGSGRNPIRLKTNGKSRGVSPSAGGVLPVAILTTDSYDATLVDADTVLLGDPDLPGSVSPIRSVVEDVDGDGDDDLLLKFSILDLVFSLGVDDETTALLLTGEDVDETSLFGIDLVTVRP